MIFFNFFKCLIFISEYLKQSNHNIKCISEYLPLIFAHESPISARFHCTFRRFHHHYTSTQFQNKHQPKLFFETCGFAEHLSPAEHCVVLQVKLKNRAMR